jgi:general secretion pathway protein D
MRPGELMPVRCQQSNAVKPILIILLVAISALPARRASTSEPADAETATAEFISEILLIKYAKAEDIADVLTSLSGCGGGNMDNIQRLLRHASISNGLPALEHLKLRTDLRSNSLLITSTRPDMETIKNIVMKLDGVLPQILIEAVILDVKLPNLGGYSKKPSRLRTPADLFIESGAMTNVQVAWVTNFAPVTATGAQLSRASGFSYVARTGQDLDSVLTDSRVTLIQKPRIQTSHEIAASLFFGRANGSLGVALEMTPLIGRDGFLELDIRQTIEEVTGKVNIRNVGDVPTTTSTVSLAKLRLQNHDTLLIGGMTRITEHELLAEAPVLKDMPRLRNLLRGLTYHTRGEIILLLRPTILPGPAAERASH